VPQNWLAADFHHGFRLVLGFLPHTCSETTSKQDNFHKEDVT
jgi:hypothetical protein